MSFGSGKSTLAGFAPTNFIELTTSEGKEVVNVAHIERLRPYSETSPRYQFGHIRTEIIFQKNAIDVKETVEQILALVRQPLNAGLLWANSENGRRIYGQISENGEI